MITPRQEQALLDATALELDGDLRDAYRKLLDLIDECIPPVDAVREIIDSFVGEYASLMADAFSVILERSVGHPSVMELKVGEVSLSTRLYAEARDVSVIVRGIVSRHAAGFQDVRALTLKLYEGYGFRASVNEPLKLSPRNSRLPKYMRRELLRDPGLAGDLARHFSTVQASHLKTPALKAAYMEAIDAMEQGAGKAVLAKKLNTAFYERMRYFANRIAQTELHRAYADRQAVEIMEDDDVAFVRWHMSGTHPKTDICDFFASVNRFGLGAGVYPKALAPKAPAHPHCRCHLQPITGMDPKTKWREHPGAAQAWVRAQGLNDGASVMGSRARRDEVLKGADPVSVWNSRTDPLYRVGRVGDATDSAL